MDRNVKKNHKLTKVFFISILLTLVLSISFFPFPEGTDFKGESNEFATENLSDKFWESEESYQSLTEKEIPRLLAIKHTSLFFSVLTHKTNFAVYISHRVHHSGLAYKLYVYFVILGAILHFYFMKNLKRKSMTDAHLRLKRRCIISYIQNQSDSK